MDKSNLEATADKEDDNYQVGDNKKWLNAQKVDGWLETKICGRSQTEKDNTYIHEYHLNRAWNINYQK